MRSWIAAFSLACLLLMSGANAAPSPPGPAIGLVLATATPGGGFPAYADALIAALREVDPRIAVEARATKGSAENVPLLEAGTVDLALVQGEVAYPALAGREDRPGLLRVVAAMYPAPGVFAVKPDSPVRTIADLRGRSVALGTEGSGLTAMARAFLRAAELDPARDVGAVFLKAAGEGPDAVASGRVDALFGGGIGWPGFVALAAAPGGIRFVGPTEAEIDRILRDNPAIRRATLPAGAYPGQDQAIGTAGSWSLILARPGLDDAVVHRFVAALAKAAPGLAARLPAGRDTVPANTAAVVPADWIHPGAVRFLREERLLPGSPDR